MNLHEALIEVHQEMQNPENWEPCGICAVVVEIFSIDEMMDLISEWPRFYSGDGESYPLPGGKEAYYAVGVEDDTPSRGQGPRCDYMWDRSISQHARDRWELLEWLIERTEDGN